MISKIMWKKILFIIISLTTVIITVGGIAAYAFVSKVQVPATESKQPSLPVPLVTINEPAEKNRINILLFGLDDGDPDNPGSPRRSDTMMVASLNPADKTVNILSIPRDSKVNIPGRPGFDKITHAFFYGGPSLAVRTVEENFHIPINYYITIDWKAFIRVVDILGGVNLNVENDMNYDDPYENLSIHLNKGYQHLNGKQSGEYVRYRHDELGDIGRVQRQENFLKALSSQMLQAGTILKLPALITTIGQYIQTDMNMYTMAKIANLLKDMKADFLYCQMVPGDFATIDELSYWLPDMAELQKIVNSKFTNQ
ncbi:LCP family protein [Sporomusa acidovorans]|uniref:Polyisoprenyl-teichoic acid--peptidoglycan teichoic acid transferase TagU n=1 Tax=Sporomusa acidovorans (strain ATCC 49682 / DSM 3132 / Mol) TaxID=1123286 RepID=A0ABZ3J3M6_SPOA4|nr:LCP family protein [Sporomusa acidovorans]OZC20034.1 regulatory protein MsrR [Sporomusa acidovorans DSM 3132]SDD46985.1 transcriptional attenuator, LytR family [Sporomusa acidovorans]